jgi:hypothetical protein
MSNATGVIAQYSIGRVWGNFDVLTDFAALMSSSTIVYEKSGVAVQTIQYFRLIGESIYYNSANPEKSVLGETSRT